MNQSQLYTPDYLWEQFCTPDRRFHPMPKWVWNVDLDQVDEAGIREQFSQFRRHDNLGGVMIVLWGRQGYFTEEFYRKYGLTLDIAAEQGLSIVLWDENGFPTGRAGGLFEQRFPELTARRLDMVSADAGPGPVDLPLPEGKLMAAVAMERHTLRRLDLTAEVTGGRLRFRLPEGDWQVLFFIAIQEQPFDLMGGSFRFMDYLNPEAVARFVDMTHQQYYERFPQHFGTTIRHAFYDEPSFWRLQGRVWTEGFNESFRQQFGYSPTHYYPALWMDIGPETQAARNALLGWRAQLYASAFVGTLADWCAGHGIELTGHMDQEEIANPVPLSGDLMKVFEHQHMPGVDEIFQYGRGSRGYKVVSSAAFNYDKPAVMCEVFGAMGEEMPVDVLYRETMDLCAKGVSFMVPHGTWYDAVHDVIFPPELSYRSAKFGPALPDHSAYTARLCAMLQGGAHVADIAVLYPIAALQAGNVFGQGDAYLGGAIAPEINYMELGELLSLDIRKDFTYIHPDMLDDRCAVEGPRLVLRNDVNRERFRVLVITGSQVIGADNARKIREFYDQGGIVMAVGRVPRRSAQFGRDAEVAEAMECIFGSPLSAEGETRRRVHANGRGGRSYALPGPQAAAVSAALDDALPVWDVHFPEPIRTTGGNLSYIHKLKDGRHLYFFANSSDQPVRTTVLLRGSLALEVWDPHSGQRRPADLEHLQIGLEPVTRVRLDIPAVHSIFFVSFTQ